MKFHNRFDIPVNLEESQRRFVNRFEITILDGVVYEIDVQKINELTKFVAYQIGEKIYIYEIMIYIGYDFYRCLQVIEAIYQFFDLQREDSFECREGLSAVNDLVAALIKQSEVDLGIQWINGKFTKTGALLMDDQLVNNPLEWLRQHGYESVYKPFEKGLGHYLESDKRPEVLADVITDAYEALEALAKIVTGEERDLSTNQQLFIKKVKASTAYKKILKEYISYANEYRHAAKEGKPKPELTQAEVESFIYLTGIFIRLAMQLKESD